MTAGFVIARDGVGRRLEIPWHEQSMRAASARKYGKSPLDEYLEAVADLQPLRVSCLHCPDWAGFEGPAAEAREVARAHRELEHPKPTRRRKR